MIPTHRFTLDDFCILLFGISLWLIYLYPVVKTGAFSHPIDWPTTVHAEGVSLTTYGKWFFEQPHRFLTDAFSGDFTVFYNYLPYYLFNLLAKLTSIPPMVLQAVYVGPFLGFLYVVLNYYFLNKVFNNKRIALIGSVLIAFMWHSRITDFYFTEYAGTTRYLHVSFVALMLGTAQGVSSLLFVPTLCVMYLAYTHNSIKYKIYYGLLLGILLQTHTLTFINILTINLFYLTLHNFLQWWNLRSSKWKRYSITLFIGILVLYLIIQYVKSYPLLPSLVIIAGGTALFAINFFYDKNKRFYLVSYPISLAVSIYYLLTIKNFLLPNSITSLPECIGCYHFGIFQLSILYFPHFLAAFMGIRFLVVNQFRNLLILTLSAFLVTLVLSYNDLVGWGNHPYRFAINLLIPMMILAAVGIYYGYIQGGKWKAVSVFLAVWFTITIAFNVQDVFQNRRPYDNPVTGTQEEYKFFKQVENNTTAEDYILTGPEYNYPVGMSQTAMILNYSRARNFIPDYRYIISKEKYLNRMELFCFFFPLYPHHDVHTGLKACENKNGTIYLENHNLQLKLRENELKNSVLQMYGIKHLASLRGKFATAINRQADSFKWKILNSTPAGTLAQVSPITLTGVTIFEKGKYHADGFTVKFEVTKAGSQVLIVAGNNLNENIGNVQIDGKSIPVSHQDNSVILLKTPLTVGKHELFLNSVHSNNKYYLTSDYIYFLNFIHKGDFYNYLTLITMEEKYDFISHIAEAEINTFYDDSLLREKNKLFTHPFPSAPAKLKYFNLLIPSGAELHFTVDLKNTTNGVRYTVLVDNTAIFKKTYTVASTEKIIIPLEKYYNQKVAISFLVYPLGSNHGDWAYWTDPRLMITIEHKQELKRLVNKGLKL